MDRNLGLFLHRTDLDIENFDLITSDDLHGMNNLFLVMILGFVVMRIFNIVDHR